MATKNTLSSELQLYKELGFESTSKNSLARNPFMRLADGTCLIGMAGGLVSRVKTKTFFGTGQYLKCWKSSDGNKPHATMSSTQITDDGIGRCTQIYYREIYKELIAASARRYNISEDEVYIDHKNHIRGDNYDENLRVATPGQNSQNRSKEKIEKAFYTLDDVRNALASGKWVRA